MISSHDVLSEARKWLGTQEQPANSNRTAIGVRFGWNGVPWCAEAVCVWLLDAGFKIAKTASAPALRDELRHYGWKSVTPTAARAGDVIFYQWPNTSSSIDHTGVVEGRHSDGRIIAIEGNTTLANGNGGVARKLRSTVYVADVVRPPYARVSRPKPAPEPHKLPPTLQLGSKGPWVRTIQLTLGKLAVTGNFGKRTAAAVKRYQKRKGLTVDGVVGPKTWKALGW